MIMYGHIRTLNIYTYTHSYSYTYSCSYIYMQMHHHTHTDITPRSKYVKKLMVVKMTSRKAGEATAVDCCVCTCV